MSIRENFGSAQLEVLKTACIDIVNGTLVAGITEVV